MLLVIDSANVKDIREIIKYFPIDGVTTNPSIIAKENKNFWELIEEIRETIGYEKEIFIQTLSINEGDIVKEANFIRENTPGPGRVIVKVPVTKEGIKAIETLNDRGIRTMATAVYTPLQGYLAAKVGATFITPYINRIDNLTGNGVNVAKEIVQIIDKHNFKSKVLAASFKNAQQVQNVCLEGVHGVTVSPDIIREFLLHPATEANVKDFSKDWHKVYGENNVINTNKIKI
ncbi:transaldolase family protein [Bacillus salipaludis]|uniref:transaldolase family protein n=1 Tax=Bacillus salipaludis TaxID=2547811 RepID=UPI002E1E10E2|nr:transaldolase family protein [Bacillus salipaludis]